MSFTIQEPLKEMTRRLSIKPVEIGSVGVSSNKRKKAPVVKLSQEEINRRKVISDIESSVNLGKNRREIADILKGLGESSQSLLTKMVRINRSTLSVS